MTEIAPPQKKADIAGALEAIHGEFPGVVDFEREFASLCFALATGVGKTRLMGAFIAYLKLAHGVNNFFVLAPNLTIYKKLIDDFTPNTVKYVFKGISEFAISPPVLTTGETYERQIASGGQLFPTTINIFNIAKISSEVRGGRSPRIRSFREEIGESYFDYLASLPDLVLLMDESHRYRATAGMRAINELKPILGLELTELPPSEWSIDYESLDQGRDDECLPRSTRERRSLGSCARLRSCWARAAARPRLAGASRSANRPTIAGARNMAA